MEIGDQAPDFNLLNQKGERVELNKIIKKGPVLLVFYPKDDTPVCTSQLKDYGKNYEAIKQLGVQTYGISHSRPESQKEFASKLALPFDLLSDYDTRTSHKYGVKSFTGLPKRALFLIGSEGKILYKHVEALGIFKRSSEEVLKSLSAALPATSKSAQE